MYDQVNAEKSSSTRANAEVGRTPVSSGKAFDAVSQPQWEASSNRTEAAQLKAYAKQDVSEHLPKKPDIRTQGATVNGMMMPLRVEAKGLHLAHGDTTGTKTPPKTDPNQHSCMFNTIRNHGDFKQYHPGGDLYGSYGGDKTHDAHLLTERLHGVACPQNLALVPKSVNMALRGMEWYTHARTMKANSAGEVFDWEAVVNYGRANMPTDFENAFPTSIEVRATPQHLNENKKWEDDPADTPFYRNVPVAVNSVNGGGNAGNEIARDRNSPFSEEQLYDRSEKALFLSDKFARDYVTHYERGLLDDENSDAILSANTVSSDFVRWKKANVQFYLKKTLSDEHLEKTLKEFFAIAQRDLDKYRVPQKMLNRMKYQLENTRNEKELQFDHMRQNVEDYFFKYVYVTNGPFPKEALEQATFWPERIFEGLTDSWYDDVYYFKEGNKETIRYVEVQLEDLEDSTPGVFRAESVTIFYNDELESCEDADYLVDNVQAFEVEGLTSYIAKHLGVSENIIEVQI